MVVGLMFMLYPIAFCALFAKGEGVHEGLRCWDEGYEVGEIMGGDVLCP